MKLRFVVLLLCGLLLASAGTIQAQSKRKLSKAEKYLKYFKFDKAASQYEKILAKHPESFEAMKGLAKVYRIQGDYMGAKKMYGDVVNHSTGIKEPKHYYYYAQALNANGDYMDAKAMYQQYADEETDPERKKWAKKMAKGMDDIQDAYDNDVSAYEINFQDFNTTGLSDFSPMWYEDDQLVFVSARGKGKDDLWSPGTTLDLYTVPAESSDSVPEVTPLPGNVNGKFQEGPVTFTSDYSEMFFSRNNYIKMKKDKEIEGFILNLKVFRAAKEDDEWQLKKKNDPELPFDTKGFCTGHPALGNGDSTLYFSWNDTTNDNHIGGYDIYVVERNGDGWGTPKNLGDKINTPGDEFFPFVANDGALFFASDGIPGFGGLDVFRASAGSSGFGQPKNLGVGINTHTDDFGLITNEENNFGYFSSNRGAEYYDDDIYSFERVLRGIVYEAGTQYDTITGATVYLWKNGTIVDSTESLPRTGYTFRVENETDYRVSATKTGMYPSPKLDVATGEPFGPALIKNIPIGGITLKGTVVEIKTDENTQQTVRTGNVVPGAMVYIADKSNNKIIDSVQAGTDGKFTARLEPNKEYQLNAEKQYYYLNEFVTVSTMGMEYGRVDTVLEMYKLGGIIRLKHIYYDFDKSNIRPDAAKELDKVVTLLKKYPDLKIQLRSHTDCRATDWYNMNLSAARAQSASQYLLDAGVPLSQIAAAGFGEVSPIYPDLCETELGKPDSQLSDDEVTKHQFNRRTEFYVMEQPAGMNIPNSEK